MEMNPSCSALQAAYRRKVWLQTLFILALAAAGLALAVIGLGVGPMKFSVSEIAAVLGRGLFGFDTRSSDIAATVILRIRLPRIAMALLAGFGLAVTGMQMQVILRNPLASPFTLGVSSGAALGAGLAVISGVSLAGGRYMLVVNAFVFALVPCVIIFLLSRTGASGHGMLILAGIAMNFIFGSVSTLLSYFSDSEELKSLSLWMMGSLGRATWQDMIPVTGILALTLPLLVLQNQKLNVLHTGDESARGLGVNVERTRLVVLGLTSLCAAAIISFTGIIGFVGLVCPHIVRLIIGNDARFLMPASGLFGAVFLLGADLIALKLIEPAVLPVGIVTAFAGGPVLLFLIVRRQRNGAW